MNTETAQVGIEGAAKANVSRRGVLQHGELVDRQRRVENTCASSLAPFARKVSLSAAPKA